MHFRRYIIAASVLGFYASVAGAQSYHAVAIPEGVAVGMSSCGWVTGNFESSGGFPGVFIYHDGAFQQVATENFVVYAVNNYGDVTGFGTGGKIFLETYMAITLYGSDGDAGVYQSNEDLDSLGTGINDAINASGFALHPSEGTKNGLVYLNSPHTVIPLGSAKNSVLSGINNSDQEVGTVQGNALARAFILDNGIFTFLKVPGAKSTVGTAISDAGDVAGYGTTLRGSSQGFIYSGGVGKFIGLAPGTYNQASTLLAVNNSGNAVGNIQDASGETHAMLYTSNSLTDLNDVSDAPEPLVTAVGISDAGEIAANAASGTAYLLVPGGSYPPNTCKSR